MELGYVFRLEVENKKLSKITLKKFVNVRKLKLIKCEGIGVKKTIILPDFKQLNELTLDGCFSVNADQIKKFPNLRTLKIDEKSSFDDPTLILKGWIGGFKSLENLSLVGCKTNEKFWPGLGRIGPSIRKFVLEPSHRSGTVNIDETIQKMPNLEVLELRGSYVRVSSSAFNGAEKLRYLTIWECSTMSHKEEFDSVGALSNLISFSFKLKRRRRMGKVARNRNRN